jgi:hypothetical protein
MSAIQRRLFAVVLPVFLTACGPIAAAPAAGSPAAAVPPPDGILDARMVTAQDGWVVAVPNGLAVTHDGGSRWTLALDSSGMKITAAGAYFRSSTDGWLLTVGRPNPPSGQEITVMRTTDGGRQWIPETPFTLPAYDLVWPTPVSVLFSDALDGWVLLTAVTSPNFSSADLYRTTDGGQTWTEVRAPFAGRVSFIDSLTGWIVGGLSGAQLAVTHDGGSTWTAESIGAPFGPPISGSAAALKVVGSGAVFARSTLNEQTSTVDIDFFATQAPDYRWTRISHLSRASHSGAQVALVDRQQWIVALGDGISVTRNAGHSWADIGGLSAPGAIDFATMDVGLATRVWGSCASFKTNCSEHADLLRTQDGGHTWVPTSLPD